MQKTNAKILTAFLLMAMTIAVIPLATASTGYVLINTTAFPSVTGQQVAAGGNINLYLGGLGFSGGQFYLILSTNGFSDQSGTPYTPTFNLANLTDPHVDTYPGPAGSGMSWSVGFGWVNGSIPKNIAGGQYFVKVFDGSATSIAVTDTYFVVTASFEVTPTSGPGGAALSLKGYAFGANGFVNLTYYNTTGTNKITIQNLVQADAIGQFTYNATAPDLMQVLTPAGDQLPTFTTIIFNAQDSTGQYNDTYNEYARGLKQVDTAIATNLWGNATISGIAKQVNQTIKISGLNFSPGAATIWWDAATVIGTTAVNATGGFTTTITVPMTSVGPHWIVVQDSGVLFYVQVTVTPTLILSPAVGPVGTTVTATGFGFPAAVGTTQYNVTITWVGHTTYIAAWALTSATGQFSTSFVVPHDAGGAHVVMALANDTAATTSVASFTVTPTLSISPSSIANNGTIVKVTATGLDPTASYTPNIDNRLIGVDPLNYYYITSIVANGTGDVTLEFVGAGFSYGLHVFSLYKGGETTLGTGQYVFFNVTLTAGDPTVDMLNAINKTVAGLSGLTGANSTMLVGISNDVGIIKSNLTSIAATLTSINNGVATVQTSVGTIQTSLSSIGSSISSVSGSMASISSDIGTIETSLSSINTKVTSIDGKTATIQTDLGTLTGTVQTINNGVATIQTDLGTLQADVADVQTSVDSVPGQVNVPIWIAVVLALIAALAAIASLLLVRRKIAG